MLRKLKFRQKNVFLIKKHVLYEPYIKITLVVVHYHQDLPQRYSKVSPSKKWKKIFFRDYNLSSIKLYTSAPTS